MRWLSRAERNDGSVRRVLYKYFLVDVVGRGNVDVIHREIYVTSRIVINMNFIQNFRCLELNRSEVIATVEWNEMKKKLTLLQSYVDLF